MEDENRRDHYIAKLTAREREALHGWLDRKSAKEIAIDLGVSHHAVEKRLKTARLKLGVATSLEAARILASAEGQHPQYQHTVAQPAEVLQTAHTPQSWRPQPLVTGAIAMLITIVASFTVWQYAAPQSAMPPAAASTHEERIAASTRRAFNLLDTDGSGFLEPPESPIIKFAVMEKEEMAGAVARVLNEAQGGAAVGSTAAITVDGVRLAGADTAEQFYREADRNGDGKVSYAEFHQWSGAQLASIAVDLLSPKQP